MKNEIYNFLKNSGLRFTLRELSNCLGYEMNKVVDILAELKQENLIQVSLHKWQNSIQIMYEVV